MLEFPRLPSYDVIVVGVGSMGAPACYWLARRGYTVLGLEQFDIAHEMGSHAGQSRIIRKAYFEHPDYVPLLERAYANWTELEKETGKKIYHRTGLLYFGGPGNEITGGVLKSASLYNIPVQKLNVVEAGEQFPQFQFRDDFEIVFEPEAGFLEPEKAIRAYVESAQERGAVIKTNEAVIEWKMEEDLILVSTARQSYRSRKLIISSGPWTSILIPSLSGKLKVTKQALVWTRPEDPDQYSFGKFPCWLMMDPERGPYYGFPILNREEFGEPWGLKSAHHFPAEIFDPSRSDRPVNVDAEEDIRYALSRWLPGANGEVLAFKSCLYTNTPDEDFIIDHLPGFQGRVAFACGFSGHGFKFASAVGEILADLCMDGKSELPIDFLSLKRFDSYVPDYRSSH